MKILFVENRYKTIYWEAIAKELVLQGHEIYWIVQNHAFKPSLGQINVIPYFTGKYQGTKNYTSDIKKVIQADRGLNYFGLKNDDFIFYYADKVEGIIENIDPDVVVGECTLYHELLTIQACKRRNIMYLHPSSCRYPVGRYSFYTWDTLAPYAFDNEAPPLDKCLEIANTIAERRSKPDYILNQRTIAQTDLLKDKLRLSISYLKGERFNTPNPLFKQAIEKQKKKNIVAWDNNAVMDVDKSDGKFRMLYALQMQPEANIDVWGHPNNNQLGFVQKIVAAMSEGDVLYVKPNPKSKYELSKELIEYVAKTPDVIALHHRSKMDSIFNEMNLIFTITGTVGIEACMSNKPLVMAGKAVVSELKNCHNTDTIEGFKKAIELVKTGLFPTLTDAERAGYIQRICQSSYIGGIGDGLHNRHYLEDKTNFKNVVNSFFRVLKSIENQ